MIDQATLLNDRAKRLKAIESTILTVFVLFFACAPLLITPYWQGVLVLCAIHALLVVSYRLITTTGGWSFAHVATMGLGAYAVAILSGPGFGLPVLLTLAIGAGVAMAFGLLICYPVLRTRQYYFFLATFAAGEALRQCFLQFKEVTGGTSGIAFIPRPIGLVDTLGFFYFVLGILCVVSALLLAFDRSRVGQTVRAVGRNEELAEALGIDTWGYRSLVFVLGSGVAGIAGGLLASYNGIISPSDFNAALMFKVVASAIVGGVASFAGPLIGLLYLTAIEQAFRGVPVFVPLVWGLSVILVLLAAPDGIDIKLRALLARARFGRSGP